MSQNIFYFNLYEFLAWWIQAFVGKLKVRCSVGFRQPYFYPSQGLQHGISIQSSKNLGKTFSEYLTYEILHRPDFWQGFLFIYLLLFPRFWTLNGLHFYFLRKQRIHYHTRTSTNMSAKLIMGTTKGCPTALGYWIDLSLYTSII